MGIFSFQVKSITVDHGKEFANYQSLEQDYQIKVYFFQATSDEILAALALINHLPLKVSGLVRVRIKLVICHN